MFDAKENSPTKLARYQLRNVTFNFNDTGSFSVTVDNVGRDSKVSKYSSRVLGQANNLLGYSPIVDDDSFRVSVQSQVSETKVTISNDSHLPCVFQNAEVEGFVVLRNTRI